MASQPSGGGGGFGSSSSSSCWTPFECLPVASQTPSGLLRLEETEVDVLQRSGAQLRSGLADPREPVGPPLDPEGRADDALVARARAPRAAASSSSSAAAAGGAHGWVDRTDPASPLSVQITTHRVVLWKNAAAGGTGGGKQGRAARFLHLGHVLSASPEASGSLIPSKRRKILLSTYLGDLLLVLSSGSDASDVLSALQRVLERKEWTKSTTQTLEQAKRLTSHRVGVDAVLAKSRIVHRQEQRISDEALAATDADELLREAAELARIIRKHVAVLERNSEIGSAAPPSSDGGVVDPESERALARMLQDMGMASALSKKDTSDYYGTVARQLADLLLPRMEGLGGIITLTDVYCLLNRARSTHLLSPEDLLRATQELEGIGVGLRVRTFRSGLVVLQDARVDDDRLAEMLRDACAGAGAGASSAGAYSMGGGMTALDASGLLNTTPLLAEEQLCWAEERGYLARDEQVETVRFYPNLFGEFAEAAAAQAAAASSSTGASPGGP